LAEKGFFSADTLETFCQFHSILGGHPEKDKIPGIEVSAGSLGHGLSIAAGIALAAQRDNEKYRVFVLMGDGECNEGSVWEAAMFASHHRLDNLVLIIDYNKLQASGRIEETLELEPLSQKWNAFGWKTLEIDGHNEKRLAEAFEKTPFSRGKPSVIIAHTIKGLGVSFMECNSYWHVGIPSKEEYDRAIKELE
jgi:transketolase